MYNITNYSKKKAKDLDVKIKPSTRKNKKIDIYKDNKFVVSIGDVRYKDYPTYINEKGLDYANKRRELYLKRHKYNNLDAGFYAKKILW